MRSLLILLFVLLVAAPAAAWEPGRAADAFDVGTDGTTVAATQRGERGLVARFDAGARKVLKPARGRKLAGPVLAAAGGGRGVVIWGTQSPSSDEDFPITRTYAAFTRQRGGFGKPRRIGRGRPVAVDVNAVGQATVLVDDVPGLRLPNAMAFAPADGPFRAPVAAIAAADVALTSRGETVLVGSRTGQEVLAQSRLRDGRPMTIPLSDDFGIGTQVAAGPDGTVLAAWIDGVGETAIARTALRRPNGRWDPSRDALPASGTPFSPPALALAVDADGAATIATLASAGDPARVVVSGALGSAADGTFDAARTVADYPAVMSAPAFVAAGSGLLAFTDRSTGDLLVSRDLGAPERVGCAPTVSTIAGGTILAFGRLYEDTGMPFTGTCTP